MTDIPFLTVHELGQRLQSGALTSAEIVRVLLDRIEQHDGKLHAFIAVYGEEALRAAEAADRAREDGDGAGPLHGIPVALKDIVELEGRITTGGSMAYADRVSPVTATLAARLLAAGMIVLGKTHTVEFAFGGWGTNQRMGTPWNPWDPDVHRTPGGSSCGSAVAVAAGLAPAAIGTDTGGSVRLPAGWCGITGLKVTVGRISTFGVMPLSHTLDTPGPMVRSVQDAALLYQAMAGPDPNDPLTRLFAAPDAGGAPDQGVTGLRLATLSAAEREGCDPVMLAAYDAAIETLRGLGAATEVRDLPHPLDSLAGITGQLIATEGYSYRAELVDDPDLPLDEDVRPRFLGGRDVMAADYLRALRRREQIKQDFEAALDGTDAWLLPTVPYPALPLNEVDQAGTPGKFTRVVNLIDRCGLSIPGGFTDAGLPLSLQISCRGGEEEMALRIGAAFQAATDWHTRHPAI